VTSVLGVILAVTLIFGETISLELQSGAVIRHEMEKEDSHFTLSGSTYNATAITDFGDIAEMIDSVEGIGKYSLRLNSNMIFLDRDLCIFLNDYNSSNETYNRYTGVYGDMPTDDTPSAPQKGSVILSRFLQERYALTTGQTINLTFAAVQWIWNENGSYVAVPETYFTQQFLIHGFRSEKGHHRESPDYYYDSYYRPTIFLNGDDYLQLLTDIIGWRTGNGLEGWLRMDFWYQSILDPSVYQRTSLTKARKNADDARDDLNEAIMVMQDKGGYYVGLETNYQYVFSDTEEYFNEIKWLLIALSVPIIIFGIYLGYLGIELFLSERRREIGMLKARGATNRQLISLLVSESLFVGAFAGFVGIILAGYGARIILHFTQASSYIDIPWYEPGFTTGGLISAILLGMLLMFASSFRLFRRVTKLEAGELLSKYSLKQEKVYNASRDTKILLFAIVCLVAIRFFRQLEDLTYRADNVILELTLGIFTYLVLPFMVLSAPYIIIMIGVRLATRGSNRFYARLAEISEVLCGELGYLIRRAISTGNRRIVNVTTVLSVLFAFLVLTSTFTFAQQDFEERIIKAEIGGDMKITFDSWLTVEEAAHFQENLTNISGIRSHVPLFSTSSNILVGDSDYVEIIVVNITQFWKIAHFDPDIFQDGDKGDVKGIRNGGVIISSNIAEKHGVETGDSFSLVKRIWRPYDATKTIVFGEVTAHGIMKTLPGLFGGNEDSVSDNSNWILIDERIIREMVEKKDEDYQEITENMRSRTMIVELESHADTENITTSLLNLENYNIRDVRVTSSEINAMTTEPNTDGFLLLLRTELGVLVFISLLASAIVVFISSFEKRNERAAIMLKGTTKRQLYLLEYGEAMVILIYSLIVGLTTGIAAGVVWIFVFNVFEGLDIISRSYWPSFAILPIIGVMVLIFLLAVTVSVVNYRKFDLIKFMRWG